MSRHRGSYREQSFSFDDTADRSARYASRARVASNRASRDVAKADFAGDNPNIPNASVMSDADRARVMRGTSATGQRPLTVGEPGDFWSKRFQQPDAPQGRYFPQLDTRNPAGGGVLTKTVLGPDITTERGGTMSGSPTTRTEAPAGPKIGDVRDAQGGGREQLVASQSGPRWVAGIASPPPVGVQNQSPAAPKMVPMSMAEIHAATDGAKTYEEKLAANKLLAAPGGMMRPVSAGRPFDYGNVDPNAVDKAGTGQNVADPKFGTASSTSGAAPQPRSIAGVAPASAHNDINTGGAAPAVATVSDTAPAVAAVTPSPITTNPSGRPDGPVPVPPVPAAYAAGKAIRSVPNAIGNAVGGLGDSAMTAANSATTGVRNIFRGITGAPPVAAGESAPMRDPTDLRTPPGMGPARQLPDIAKSFFSPSVAGSAGNAVRQPPPVAPVPPGQRIAAQTAGGSSPNRNDYMNHGTLTTAPTPIAPVPTTPGLPQPGFDPQGNMIRKSVFGGVKEDTFAYRPSASTEDEDAKKRRLAGESAAPFSY